MVFLQHLPRVGDVQVVLGGGLPGQADHPVQVGLDDRVLGGLGGHLAHAVELALGLLLGLFRHARGRDAPLELLDLGLLLVPLAQLLLDGLASARAGSSRAASCSSRPAACDWILRPSSSTSSSLVSSALSLISFWPTGLVSRISCAWAGSIRVLAATR